MVKEKRKIYDITLWAVEESAKVHIDEYFIKRKGKDSIQVEGNKTIYAPFETPISGITLGENEVTVNMTTEDLLNFDTVIDNIIQEARKRIDEEIKVLESMQKHLDKLEKFKEEITLANNEHGYSRIEKNEKNEIVIVPLNKAIEPIFLKDYAIQNKQ